MKRFHPGVALLLSLLWEVRWAVRGALPCPAQRRLRQPRVHPRGSALGRDLELRGWRGVLPPAPAGAVRGW